MSRVFKFLLPFQKAAIPNEEGGLIKKESCEFVQLPWEDLMITCTVDSERAKTNLKKCDSSVEIPWHAILFDPNIKIDDDGNSKKCLKDELEIPWDDLLLPKNIVFASKNKCSSRKRLPKTSNRNNCGCSRSKQ